MDFAPVWCRVRFEPRHFLTISGVRNFTQDFFLCDETRAWLCFGCKECAGFPRSGCQSPFFHTAPSIGGLFQTSFQTPPRSAYLTSLQKWNHFPFEKSHFLDWFSIIWRSRSWRIVRRTVGQVLSAKWSLSLWDLSSLQHNQMLPRCFPTIPKTNQRISNKTR